MNLEVARDSAAGPATLYLAGSRRPDETGSCRSAFYRSGDGGASWASADAGLPGEIVAKVVADPGDSRTVYAGMGVGFSSHPFGVSKSTDAGATWTPTGLDDKVILSLAASPEPGVLWAGTLGEVFRSHDFGATWEELSGDLTLTPLAFAFAENRVYAATTTGVWILENEP